MTTGILTFHSAQNCGSALQAMALRRHLLEQGHDASIINFVPERQAELYAPTFCGSGLKMALKRMAYPRMADNERQRFDIYQRFAGECLGISEPPVTTIEGVGEAIRLFDRVICGSDQIWNTGCHDHSPAYFLPFPDVDCRREAYAISLGPNPESVALTDEAVQAIRRFDVLTARDPRSAAVLSQVAGRDVAVVPDPTMLFDKEFWIKTSGDESPLDRPYIFLYSPQPNRELYREANEMAKRDGLDVVVILDHFYKTYLRNPRWHYLTWAGPLDFLTITRHAQKVMAASYHAAIFANIFHRPLHIPADAMATDARLQSVGRL